MQWHHRLQRSWNWSLARLFPQQFLRQNRDVCEMQSYWEVLNGVGVDGAGVIFLIFYAFFLIFHAFLPFLHAFLRFSLLFSSSPKGQGQTTAIYCKNGEFHSACLHRPRAKLPEVRKILMRAHTDGSLHL